MLLSVAAMRAFAATLLDQPVRVAGLDGEVTQLEAVLQDAKLVEPPAPSHLPGR